MSTKWCTVAALGFFRKLGQEVALPFQLGNGVRLTGMHGWMKDDEITKYLSQPVRDELRDHTRYVLAVDYEAASLGDPEPDWEGEQPRSKQSCKGELLEVTNHAIWLAKPSPLGFAFIVSAEKPAADWHWREWQQCRRLWPHKDYHHAVVGVRDLQVAAALAKAISELPRNGAVWVAASTLWRGLLNTLRDWEVRYLLSWIALEALFGAAHSASEITYRISQRIAVFLGTDSKSRLQLFEKVKRHYHERSKVVHGLRLRKLKPEEMTATLYEVEEIARKALNKILLDATVLKTFNSKRRDAYLDGLVLEKG